MLNINTKHRLLLTAIATSTLMWGGCRSVPGLKRFARSSEPSADVLAGTGPSATYPAPPSVAATPQAIASVAGGTASPKTASIAMVGGPGSHSMTSPTTSPQNAQVAGIDVSPGYATPATNYAAANANGVHKKTSPYTFGSKTFSPKSAPETSPALPVSNYAKAVTSPTNQSSFGMPKTTAPPTTLASSGATTASPPSNYAMPPSPPTVPVSASFGGKSNSTGGFTLPTNMPSTATASITPPPASTGTTTASGSFGMPADASLAGSATEFEQRVHRRPQSTPTYQTADVSGSVPSDSPPQSSYMPGSTGKTSG